MIHCRLPVVAQAACLWVLERLWHQTGFGGLSQHLQAGSLHYVHLQAGSLHYVRLQAGSLRYD